MAPCVIAIVGPTGTGKTALSVALAQQLGTDILCADSRTVYQGLDIGTAKPTGAERGGIVHHGVDVAQPTEAFTVAQYQALAAPVVTTLLTQGKSLVVVGGTGFYCQALLQSPSQVPSVAPNPLFRDAMQQQIQTHGLDSLYERLIQLDPTRARQLYPQDAVRIVRALEIIDATGQPVPQSKEEPPPFPVVWVGLRWSSTEAHRLALAKRIEAQVAAGWLEETQQLMDTYGSTAHALQATLGYPEWMAVLRGESTPDEAMASVVTQTQQYARRQRTWFQRNKAITWLNVDELPLEHQVERVKALLHQEKT